MYATMTYQLHLGDCLEFMRTMEAGSVDAVITDLPYGTTDCTWDTVIPFAPMWEQVERMLKPRGAFVTTASQPFTSALVMSNLDWFRYAWVWDKNTASDFLWANRKPLKYHEDICVFAESMPRYYPQKWEGSPTHQRKSEKMRYREHLGQAKRDMPADTSGQKFPKSIIFAPKHTSRENLHPTQKPVALYEYLIRTYTNEGDTVLDFVMGSGTTGVACMQTGRKFIGCEIDPGYFAIAEKRIAQAAAQLSLLEAAD